MSLGASCVGAMRLRELGLRHFAAPFDWVRAPADAVVACIDTRFAHFHTSLREIGVSHPAYYHESRCEDSHGIVFIHDYPHQFDNNDEHALVDHGEVVSGYSWQAYTQVVHAKYERRIKRFQEILVSSEPVVFVYSSLVRGGDALADGAALLAAVQRAYGKANAAIVVASTSASCSDSRVVPIGDEWGPPPDDVEGWSVPLGMWQRAIERAASVATALPASPPPA